MGAPLASPPHMLLSNEDLISRFPVEEEALGFLHTKTFGQTRVFDGTLLGRTGMMDEFLEVFRAIGCENFWYIDEPGCELLTKEFLMTLYIPGGYGMSISFRLFNREYALTFRELSDLLGFHMAVSLSDDFADFSPVAEPPKMARV